MKVTAFIGSARKMNTYHATLQLLYKLQSLGDIDYEVVHLSNYKLESCKGCKLCLDKGEELCPLNDDRDYLIGKILASDGVIFASPNYSFQVSGQMKIFLDRLGFFFHRPQFFGKTFTSIVTQGIYGGGAIVKYFNFIGNAMGFNVVKGNCLTMIEPLPEKARRKNEVLIERHSKRFYSILAGKRYPNPSFFELMVFRMSRTSLKKMIHEEYRDHAYYLKNGWFESDFYYPVKLTLIKKVAGRMFDMIAIQMSRNQKQALPSVDNGHKQDGGG